MGPSPNPWLLFVTGCDKDHRRGAAEDAFRLYYSRIYNYLRQRTASDEDAEELAQRVFADAAAALASNDPPTSILAWLYAVAERRFIDELRRRRREATAVAEYAAIERPNVGPAYGADLAGELRKALDSLPAEQRKVVVMKIFEGRRFVDIARELGRTEAACKMRFSRALRALREILAGEGIVP